MSILGDILRVDPGELEALRSHRETAYERLSGASHIERVDLDRSWDVLRFLLDSVGIPVNPISGGSLYPDPDSAWGYDGNSRMLTADQVRQVADFLNMTPFATLAVYLPAASQAPLYNARLDLSVVRDRLEDLYRDLINFFDAAASDGQCTIFWAA